MFKLRNELASLFTVDCIRRVATQCLVPLISQVHDVSPPPPSPLLFYSTHRFRFGFRIKLLQSVGSRQVCLIPFGRPVPPFTSALAPSLLPDTSSRKQRGLIHPTSLEACLSFSRDLHPATRGCGFDPPRSVHDRSDDIFMTG